MAECRECKSFFVSEDSPEKGDCIQRVVDPRQAYYRSVPVNADKSASQCLNFIKK
ncbi:MAG: benzylsuccinate synthase gamma subunit family protein [Desulfatibacillum sp.]|nr:benzylsuccinate synthase gamma subunit family protein [Desulfatibacillum sp.]